MTHHMAYPHLSNARQDGFAALGPIATARCRLWRCCALCERSWRHICLVNWGSLGWCFSACFCLMTRTAFHDERGGIQTCNPSWNVLCWFSGLVFGLVFCYGSNASANLLCSSARPGWFTWWLAWLMCWNKYWTHVCFIINNLFWSFPVNNTHTHI